MYRLGCLRRGNTSWLESETASFSNIEPWLSHQSDEHFTTDLPLSARSLSGIQHMASSFISRVVGVHMAPSVRSVADIEITAVTVSIRPYPPCRSCPVPYLPTMRFRTILPFSLSILSSSFFTQYAAALEVLGMTIGGNQASATAAAGAASASSTTTPTAGIIDFLSYLEIDHIS